MITRGNVLSYFAQSVDEPSDFYTFKTEKRRDAFVRRHDSDAWTFGRIVMRDNGYESEIIDGHFGG